MTGETERGDEGRAGEAENKKGQSGDVGREERKEARKRWQVMGEENKEG